MRFVYTKPVRPPEQFHKPPADVRVDISCSPPLSREMLEAFTPYQTWRTTLAKSLAAQDDPSHPFHSDPYMLETIEVQSCDFFARDRPGFLKLRATIGNDSHTLPGAVFMRGGSVAVFVVVQAPNDDSEYVLLTIQPRIPAGSLSFVELPAGTIERGGFAGAAAREIRNQTGFEICESELVDMTRLAVEERDGSADEEHLRDAVYPSPGGSDEYVPIFLARKTVQRADIERLVGNLHQRDGGRITLAACRMQDVWKVAARDGKALAALALYQGLEREGWV